MSYGKKGSNFEREYKTNNTYVNTHINPNRLFEWKAKRAIKDRIRYNQFSYIPIVMLVLLFIVKSIHTNETGIIPW